jgi:hypothetical protein
MMTKERRSGASAEESATDFKPAHLDGGSRSWSDWMGARHIKLRDLDGGYSSLDAWRGRRVFLIFIQPECPHSRKLLPVIAGLHPDPPDHVPAPILISVGQIEENRLLAERFGLRCPLLVQDDMELATAFMVDGTPAGCLIDESGRLLDMTRTGSANVLIQAGVMPGPDWSWSTSKYRPAGYLYYHWVAPRVARALRPRKARRASARGIAVSPPILRGAAAQHGEPPLVSASRLHGVMRSRTRQPRLR